jgi:hypothetical protein
VAEGAALDETVVETPDDEDAALVMVPDTVEELASGV